MGLENVNLIVHKNILTMSEITHAKTVHQVAENAQVKQFVSVVYPVMFMFLHYHHVQRYATPLTFTTSKANVKKAASMAHFY